MTRWLFTAMPLGRLAIFRTLVYLYVVIDVLWLQTSGWYHGYADPIWYEPLRLGQLLHLPAATVVLVQTLKWGSVAAALVAATGRLPRLAGTVVAVCWIWYMYVAYAYGKVDHDRGDFVVALLLLPTVGSAYWRDRRLSEAAGFVLRAAQLAAIATYFLSAWAKVRFGGWEWVNSATMARAVVRRGTPWVKWLLDVPELLHLTQWGLFVAEMSSPLIFVVPEKWRRRMVMGWFAFHAVTYASITIAFWPHLVMMLAFLPLETYADRFRSWWLTRRSGRVGVVAGEVAAGEAAAGERMPEAAADGGVR
ncbi:hypothetical protein [Nostocoides vanveenii]